MSGPAVLRPIARAFALVLALSAGGAMAREVPEYVGSEACVSCHTDAAEAWEGSDHALAWTMPTADNILADFDGTSFESGGMKADFRIEDGTYRITVTEMDGSVTDYAVHSVAGIKPLQQFLIETEPGRVQSFDFAWDAENKAWYDLYPDQALPPSDGLHWTGPYKTWNTRCAECHATDYEKNYDGRSRRFSSTQAEIGVGCEACHGPGAAHLEWLETGKMPASSVTLDSYGFSEGYDSAEALIQQCAGCHSRREAFGQGNPLPGTPYHDAYRLSQLRPGLYHPDGQILDEVYVYGSFLQSKMYAKGVACNDCHDPHTTELVAEGNAVCAQCHSPAGNPRFPSLTLKAYDTPEHHHHAEGSEGAQCVSCHMPDQAYMQIDWRRDHSLRVPRPDLSAETGAPDACTTCHEGETPEWAAEVIEGWFPDPANRGAHYGQVLAQGFADPVVAAPGLNRLAQDTDQAGLVRATSIWLLEQTGDAQWAEAVEPLLADPNPDVRAAAVNAQRSANPQDRVVRLVNLLRDPSRLVRMTAAQQMVDAPIARLPRKMSEDLQAAQAELHMSLAENLDYPETHLKIAGSALAQRNFPIAVQAFREAVRLDPQQLNGWIMLARIAGATQGPGEAQKVLEEALGANPGNAVLEEWLAAAKQQ